MKRLCFFSSASRPLYKQDVFRAMSYPKGYVIHFRYQEKHIVGNFTGYDKKEALIFFSVGNDLNVPESQRAITNIPIREVLVKAVEKAEDTGQIHFYLELGDFKAFDIVTSNPIAIMPPNKFVTELEVSNPTALHWYQVVDSIKANFPCQLFYKFEIKDTSNNVMNPVFDDVEKQSYFKLSDEKNYALDMAFYDTEPSDSSNYHGLKIAAMDGGLIQLAVPETIDIDTRKDNRVYSLFTKTSSSRNAFTYINFSTLLKSITATVSSSEEETVVDTVLKLQVVKSKNRSVAFAFYTMLAASVLVYGKLISDQVDLNGTFSWNLTIQFILCSLLGMLAAYNLYRLFDKK